MLVFTIYCDSVDLREGRQIQQISPALANAQVISIKQTVTENPLFIQRLLRYDRPDVILVWDKKPVLVIELTSEVPSGHNVGQRWARLVRSVEEGIITVFFTPYRSRKHGTFTAPCKMSKRYVDAADIMTDLHNAPILLVNWPVDDNAELILGEGLPQFTQENGDFRVGLSELINDLIRNDFDYERCNTINALQERTRELYATLTDGTDGIARLKKSVIPMKTDDYLTNLQQRLPDAFDKIPGAFRARENTLVYTIGVTENIGVKGKRNCNREDPFVGNQFALDYCYCRNGPGLDQRHTNFVMCFPNVHREVFEEDNPNNPTLKSRLYYMVADHLEFTDDIILNDLEN
tara:strand:+ start:196 stop:1239 length:1044 start_codon:yes stop_codon:yes gene_type:complete